MFGNKTLHDGRNSSSRKYNVAFLRHGDKEMGGGLYSELLTAKYISKSKFNIQLLYSCDSKIVELYRKEGISTQHVPLNRTITSVYKDNINYNPVQLLKLFWHMIEGVVVITKSIRKNKIDVLVLCDNLSKIIGSIAAKITGAKVVSYSRDTFVENLIGKILRFFILNLSDKVIAVSNKTAQFFMESRKSDKVVTIHNGVEVSRFNINRASSLRGEMGIGPEKVVIGCIAVFLSYKGHVYLMRALKQLQSAGIENVTCLLIGQGELKGEIREMVDTEDIKDVHFLGFRDDIPDLLKTMDFLVIPSIAVEGFPRVAIEAMAMRLPVIGTTVGGIPEAIVDGETGILVAPGDIDALSNAIEYLINNPEARVNMGNAGRNRVEEKFSIESNVRQTEQLFLEVSGA